MTTIRQLCIRSHENSKAKGFWDGQLGDGRSFIPEKLMLIVSELAEALEAYRVAPLGDDVLYLCRLCSDEGRLASVTTDDYEVGHERTCWLHPDHVMKPEGLAAELADAMIRIADLAERLGIDLERVCDEKHAYNRTRPHKHGGKAC